MHRGSLTHVRLSTVSSNSGGLGKMPNGPRRELSGSWVIPLPCNIFPRCPTTSTLGRARCDRPGSRGTVLGAGGGADRRRFLTERRRWSRPRSGSWRGAQHSLQVRSHRQQQHHRRLRIGVSRRGELQARPPSRSAVFSSASRQQRPGGACRSVRVRRELVCRGGFRRGRGPGLRSHRRVICGRHRLS